MNLAGVCVSARSISASSSTMMLYFARSTLVKRSSSVIPPLLGYLSLHLHQILARLGLIFRVRMCGSTADCHAMFLWCRTESSSVAKVEPTIMEACLLL